MDFLEQFKRDYDVTTTQFSIAGRNLNLFVPASIDRFINADDVFNRFPLWTKIWEATAVLTLRLSAIPPDPSRRFLEIGAGMGVAGLSAMAMGQSSQPKRPRSEEREVTAEVCLERARQVFTRMQIQILENLMGP